MRQVSKLSLFTVLIATAAAAAACSSRSFENGPESIRVPASGNPDTSHTTYLEQGWNREARQNFYYGPQGSHLMPYDWAKSMENAGDKTAFLTSRNLARFGYIPQAPTDENPDGLPIGFTKDELKKKAQLGINCAACHTSEIRYRANNIRIDGGPSMSDFQGFVNAMDKAIFKTAEDSDKFQRFAERVLRTGISETAKSQLRHELSELVKVRQAWQRLNSSSTAYGHGRNDAFGIIFNQVLAKDLKHAKGGAVILENGREPNAPVSYPVLWDAPYHDIVQWIGIARNNLEEKGPLSRNIGQVLGVFGHVNFDDETKILGGYCSSARRKNLEGLENEVKTLWSPKWPEQILGEINKDKAAAGKKVFDQTCVKCHGVVDRLDPKRIIHSSMVPISVVKTDPLVASNAALRTALSGQLKGKKLSVAEGRPMEDVEPASVVLRHAVAGSLVGSISPITCQGEIDTNLISILRGWRKVAQKAASGLFTKAEMEKTGTLEERLKLNEEIFMRYKARPLNGIWASAPYLHNASVKNLRELLLPAEQRSKKFTVGCTEFDPANVGIECEGTKMASSVSIDTSIAGNSNSGHEFGVNLSNDERDNLLEYLKTL